MYALTNHSADEFIIIIFPRTLTQFTRMSFACDINLIDSISFFSKKKS